MFKDELGYKIRYSSTTAGYSSTKLHELMNRLGLVYGAIDLRLTPDGRYVFLEINPAGQFLYIEKATGQPITAALAQTFVQKGERLKGAALLR